MATWLEVHNRINVVRNAHGRGDCVYDSCLSQVATNCINYIINHDHFDHPPNLADGSAGCNDNWNGEILLWHWPPGITARSIVQQWYQSPTHQAVLLSPLAHRLGVQGKNGTMTAGGKRQSVVVWCGEFGS